MKKADARTLSNVDMVPFIKKHLHHMFREVRPDEDPRYCGYEEGQDDHPSCCGKPLTTGDLISALWEPSKWKNTPPFCKDCEAKEIVAPNMTDITQWPWARFDVEVWEAMVAGYMEDPGPHNFRGQTKYEGHRLMTAVERACYFDALDRNLSAHLDTNNRDEEEPTLEEDVATWYASHPAWSRERDDSDNFLLEVISHPNQEEMEWARFWWDVIHSTDIKLEMYPRLHRLLWETGNKKNRFEILFDE